MLRLNGAFLLHPERAKKHGDSGVLSPGKHAFFVFCENASDSVIIVVHAKGEL